MATLAGMRRRAATLARSPGPWSRVLLLVLLGLLARHIASANEAEDPKVFLHQAPNSAKAPETPIGYFTRPGSVSSAVVRHSTNTMHIHRQTNALARVPEARWGHFFSRQPGDVVTCPRAPLASAQPLLFLPVPQHNLPVIIERNSQSIALFHSSTIHPLPNPDTEIVAVIAPTPEQADFLVLLKPPSGTRDLAVMNIERDLPLRQNALTGLSPAPDPVLGVPGPGRSVYSHYLQRIRNTNIYPASQSPSTRMWDTFTSVVHLLATRLTSPQATCPGGDVILLMVNGQFALYNCFNIASSSPNISPSYSGSIPESAMAGGRFINPDLASIADPMPFLYYVGSVASTHGADTGLWRADMRDIPNITWHRVVLPPVVSQSSLERARLLNMSIATGGQWFLLIDGVVFFDSEAFGCATDTSIVCDVDGASTGTTRGWACKPGRLEAPFATHGRLCDGCSDGSYMDWADGSRACRPCPGFCRTCAEPSRCLLCKSGTFMDPQGACTSICPLDMVPKDGVCQLLGLAQVSLAEAVPEEMWPLSGDSGPLQALAETHLASAPDGGPGLVLPAAVLADPQAARGGILLFFAHGATRLAATGSIGQSPKPAPVEVPPLSGLDLDSVASLVELGPFSDLAADTVLGYVFCTTTGIGRVGFLSCVEDPRFPDMVCSGDPLSTSAFTMDACREVRRLDSRRALALGPDQQAHVVSFSESGGLTVDSLSPVAGAVRLPDHPARWAPSPGLPADWYLSLDGQGRPALSMVDLLSRDSRLEALAGKLLLAPGAWSDVAMLRTAGPGRRDYEPILTRVQSGKWQVAALYGDGLVSGRTINLPHPAQTLALASELDLLDALRVLPLEPAGLTGRPGALLLLARGVVGLALLRCPDHPTAGPGACYFQTSAIARLPAPPSVPEGITLQGPVFLRPGPGMGAAAAATAADPEGHVLTLLAFSPEAGLMRLVFTATCSMEGTYGLDCEPCDGACRTCTGPGPEDCTSCLLALPSAPDACLAACPGGLFPSPDGRPLCLCRAALPEAPDICLPACPDGRIATDEGLCGCNSNCQMCDTSRGRPAVCVFCYPGTAMAAGGMSPASCFACHTSCDECTLPDDAGACTSCPPGAWLLDGTCVAACPAGTWPDAPTRACHPCPASCATCQSAGACATCPGQHYLGPDSLCQPCDGSCAACEGKASCGACKPGLVFLSADPQQASLCGSTCAPGEYVGAGRCAACDGSCELCAGGPDRCQVCAPGFRWSAAPGPGGTGTCVACEPGCASCTSTVCLSCEAGLLLTAAGACVSACPAGSFSNGESCQPCDVSCVTCADGRPDQCTGCAAELELVEVTPGVGTCASGCPEGQYRAGVDCLPCDAACATCNGPTDKDCWRCASGVLQDDDCVQACAARHVAMAGRCLPCHVSCAECMGTRSTECLPDCAPDLLALPAGQSPMRCVPACPVGYHTSMGGCRQCTEHCASCPESSDTCALCERGWLLDAPSCVTECPPSSVAQGGLCATCHATCATCYGPEPGHCLTCGPATPLLVGGTCFEACPPGTFQQDTACLPCHAGCPTCSGPESSECTSCAGDRVLHQGTCLLGCPGGWFAEDGVCAACHPLCLLCDRADGCTACPAGGLLGPDSLCVEVCPRGTRACPVTGRCEGCPEGCTACESSGDAACTAVCTACAGGWLLSGGQCVSACPAGEYAVPGGHSCAACSHPCRTCLGAADACTGCLDGLLLQQQTGVCGASCPRASAPFEGVCLSCADGCEECAAGPGQAGCELAPGGPLSCPPVAGCARCAGDRLLLEGAACVATCPDAFFPDHDIAPPSCSPCDPACSACFGPGPEDCEKPSGPGSSRIGLAVGLAVGLLVLLILLILLVLFCVRRRAKAGPTPKELDAEDATMLNTIVELALPGAILVGVDADFRPLDEQLGAGTQASVYAAQAVGAGIVARLGCPDVVAVKKMRTEAMTPVHHAMFQNEVALMWLLREHGNIVRLYGYSEQPPAIVMERYQTDLATLLHSEVPLSSLQLADICQQWATGLEAMHAHGIAHCDLKPGNVFASQRPDGSWRAALGDLGTSRNLSADRSSVLVNTMPELNAMTVRYAAPEVITAFRRGTPLDAGHFFPADMYAAGIMLLECLTRSAAWPGMDLSAIVAAVQAGQRPDASTFPGTGPFANAGDLVRAAWQADPARRPDAAVLRQRCATFFIAAGGLGRS